MGQKIIGSFLELLRRNGNNINFESVIITGPNIPDAVWDKFLEESSRLPVRLVKFTPDMDSYMKNCDMVIATGGYNTVAEILAHNKKALIIPRAMFRREQTIRAEKLSELGLINYLNADSINADLLYEKIKESLSDNNYDANTDKIKDKINLDGTHRLVTVMGKLIGSLSANGEK